MNKKITLSIIFAIVFIGMTINCVSANNYSTNLTATCEKIDLTQDINVNLKETCEDDNFKSIQSDNNYLNNNNENKSVLSISNNDFNSNKTTNNTTPLYSASNNVKYDLNNNIALLKTTDNSKTNHHIKYIKIDKYKIPVWSYDDLDTQRFKVIKFLKKYIKKPHTYKIHGIKFKVSAKHYRQILFYKKFGFDGSVGLPIFKYKTNQYYTYKLPQFKTKKITRNVWKHRKVLSYESVWGDGWSDSYSHDISKYYRNGWKYEGIYTKYYTNGMDEYIKLKKKVKTTTYEDVLTGYKKIRLKVSVWSVESRFRIGVQFRGTGYGYKNMPISKYYML